jgi:hypothetical protein
MLVGVQTSVFWVTAQCNQLAIIDILEETVSFLLPGGGVGQVPKRGCLLTLAYYVFPRWYKFVERRRKTCPSATLSTTNPTWIEPGANPGLRGESPATNDLSHGTGPTVAFIFKVVNIWLRVQTTNLLSLKLLPLSLAPQKFSSEACHQIDIFKLCSYVDVRD